MNFGPHPHVEAAKGQGQSTRTIDASAHDVIKQTTNKQQTNNKQTTNKQRCAVRFQFVCLFVRDRMKRPTKLRKQLGRPNHNDIQR